MSGLVKHRRQLNGHKPEEGIYGDCQRTCIAMLTGLEPREVPHFCDPNECGADWRKAMTNWLASRGLGLVSFALDVPTTERALEVMGDWVRGPATLAGKSPRGDWNHIVVVDEDGAVLDPHPSDHGIAGPGDDGFFWVEALIALPTSDTREIAA